MKKLLVTALVAGLLTAGLATGCGGVKVIGSGNLVTETHDYSGFTGIKAENGIEVELIRGDDISVVVTADDNVIEYIEVSKSGDTLRIKPKANTQFRSATLTARITMPELYKLEMSGGSNAEISGFSSSHDLEVRLSGGSHISRFITPGNITAGKADFDLSGGSHVNLTGSADSLNVKCSGGSHINLEGFEAGDADIKLSGGSHATVNVSGTLNVDLSGGSEVIYTGNPTMGDIEVDWDSDLTPR